MKNNHKKHNGRIADLSVFMTMNFIKAPATSIAMILLINQASGRMIVSTIPTKIERNIEITIMTYFLSRQIEVISMK
jgi:hypothetical protein